MAKTALVLGVTGQDGAYLARFLLEKGYAVHGTSRDAAMARTESLERLGLRDRIALNSVSTVDLRSVLQALEASRPDEVYNLSGQSSVSLSFSQPAETIESIIIGTLNILEAIRLVDRPIRFYGAASSECFGDTGRHPANENTPFRPRSPYCVAKAAAVALVANYRDSYGLFAVSGLLFNHESPLRSPRFVTRKITSTAARIAQGSAERLRLGNIDVARDWGLAPDYIEAMWLMLQQPTADDFVIATGTAHTLKDFLAAAFSEVGLDWRDYVDQDPALARPSDIAFSVGDPAKAARILAWRPRESFTEIVRRMIRAEFPGGEMG